MDTAAIQTEPAPPPVHAIARWACCHCVGGVTPDNETCAHCDGSGRC